MAARSLGTLTLDVIARVGGFERGMDKAEREAQKRSKAIAKAVEDASAIAITAFGALSAAGVAAFAVLNHQAEKLAGFQGLAEKIGDTAEAVASLKLASDVSGVSLDTVGSASVRLTASLAKTDDEAKGAAAAISALGLNFRDFKKLSPVEQIDAVAKAMNQLGDGSEKTAIAVQIFGKAGAELIPFLNDLADGSERQTKLTSEQIRQADEYTKSTARLKSQFESFLQQQTAQAIPVLTQVQEAFAEIAKQESTVEVVTSILNTAMKAAIIVFQTIAVVGSDVGFVFMSVGREIGAWAAQLAALARGDMKGFRAISEAVKEDAERARAELDAFQKRIMSIGEPQAEPSGDGSADQPKKTGVLRPYIAFDAEAFTKSIQEQQNILNEAQRLGGEFRERERKREEDAAERTRIAIEEGDRAWQQENTEAWKAWEESQGRIFEKNIKEFDRYIEQFRGQLQSTIGQGLESLITGNFKNIGDSFKNLLIRMAADYASSQITKKLFESFGFAGGFSLSGARANGGPVSSGGTYLVGERGPELFTPSVSGSIVPNNELVSSMPMRGQIVYSPVYHIDARADRAEILQLVDRSVREGNAQLVDKLCRQGALR